MEYTLENFEIFKKSLIDCGDILDKLPQINDGGPCNFDSVAFDFKGWPISKVKQLPFVSDRKLTSRFWKGSRFIEFSPNGVGFNRTHRMETAQNFLKERGIDCVMYYQLD